MDLKPAIFAGGAGLMMLGAMAIAWKHDEAALRKCTYTVILPGGQEIKGLYATQWRNVFLTKDGREVRLNGSYVTTEEMAVE